MQVIILDGDKELKKLTNYIGAIPQIGQKIVFLSGEGVFEIINISWQTSREDWYEFLCLIQVKCIT